MSKSQIIIYSVALAFVLFRLYQKFMKKDKSKTSEDSKQITGTSFPSTSKDDDYEPYSKK
jgi:hypothetical protein